MVSPHIFPKIYQLSQLHAILLIFSYLFERAREIEVYVVLEHVKNKLHEDVQTGVLSQIANTDCLINHDPFREQVSS